jgi:hypothetical protein
VQVHPVDHVRRDRLFDPAPPLLHTGVGHQKATVWARQDGEQ